MRVLLLLVLAGCASHRSLDRDLGDPSYYQGHGVPVTNAVAVGGASATAVPPTVYAPSSTFEGMIVSAVSLATQPHYYRPSTIGGICVIGEIPLTRVACRHLPVEIFDAQGKSLGVATTDDAGEFAFFVRKGELYRLDIADARFERIAAGPSKLLSMGDRLVLNVRLR